MIILVMIYNRYFASSPVAAPTPVATQKVFGNNGTVSGNVYCAGYQGKPWNNELPLSWNGAKCVSSDDARWNCDVTPTTVDPNVKQAIFTCSPTGAGWNTRNVQWVNNVGTYV